MLLQMGHRQDGKPVQTAAEQAVPLLQQGPVAAVQQLGDELEDALAVAPACCQGLRLGAGQGALRRISATTA